MPRFFVPRAELGENFLVLTGENAAHARVLRLKNGDAVTVCDGEGEEWHCVVSDVAPGQVSLVVQEHTAAKSEAAVFCSVYMAFAKADKFEHVIQKATELGAAELVAFPSARCVSRPDERSLAKKLERWQKIAVSAAEQCGRGRIPRVTALYSFREALAHASHAELRLLPYENEQSLSLRTALEGSPLRTVAVMTGPEGGFEPDEVALAQEYGFQSCTLGPRILRCETAPLCALTAILYAAGALD